MTTQQQRRQAKQARRTHLHYKAFIASTTTRQLNDFTEAEQVEAMAEATLTLIGPDPYAAQHLDQLRRALDLHCAIQGCHNQHRANGLCDNHLQQHKYAMTNEAHTINRRKIA